jgi:FtsH-binding integral membrane protein
MQKFEDNIEPDIQLNEGSEEDGSLASNSRNNFIKKVYSILSVQLLITVIFVASNMLSLSFAKFQAEETWALILAAVVSIVSIIVLVCVRGFAKEYPKNMVCLLIFTLAESYMVSCICGLYTAESVLNAAVATLAATVGLSLYAYKSKSDFTECMHFMMGISPFMQVSSGVSS